MAHHEHSHKTRKRPGSRVYTARTKRWEQRMDADKRNKNGMKGSLAEESLPLAKEVWPAWKE